MHVPYAITRVARLTLDVLLITLIVLILATVIVARVIPVVTGGATFVVGGGSMEPAIPLGSLVIATPVSADQLAVGDTVSVKVGRQQAVFTHRIVRLVERGDGLWLETKGDANAEPDPSIIRTSAVIGRVVASIPYAGYPVRLLGTAQGVMFAISLGVLVLAGAWLLEHVEHELAAARRPAGLVTSPSPEQAARERAPG